ncbi:hypothetical protein Q8A67_024862 [Cirrhinus molitorella]|uniref:Ig-like domain-containing protein n=1 Tax=Cirrhinus molitorella TaxID=172907 RepID=A0AA88TKJ2_9TELE|nr:hypothetical protein Q8A67_024862 [Cirrhinus molitorella]
METWEEAPQEEDEKQSPGRRQEEEQEEEPAGPAVKPSVSLLPPSSLQISGDSAALLCLLSSYSPQGAQVSWTLDGSEVTEGVQTSAESERDGRYSRSSVLSLSKARWEGADRFVCRVKHNGADQEASFLKSSEC